MEAILSPLYAVEMQAPVTDEEAQHTQAVLAQQSSGRASPKPQKSINPYAMVNNNDNPDNFPSNQGGTNPQIEMRSRKSSNGANIPPSPIPTMNAALSTQGPSSTPQHFFPAAVPNQSAQAYNPSMQKYLERNANYLASGTSNREDAYKQATPVGTPNKQIDRGYTIQPALSTTYSKPEDVPPSPLLAHNVPKKEKFPAHFGHFDNTNPLFDSMHPNPK